MRVAVLCPLLTLLALCNACASGGLNPSDGSVTPLDQAPPGDGLDRDVPASPDLRPDPDHGAGGDLPWTPDKTVPPPDKAVPKPDAGPSGPVAPFTLDFEQNNGGLGATKDWEWGKLAFSAGVNCDGTPTPPPAPHSGTHCWGTKLNDCYSPLGNAANSCSNQNLADDSVLTLTFSIPAAWTDAYLSYWEWTDYFLTYDWSEVYVQGKITRQDCSAAYTKPVSWVRRVLNLKQQVGKQVTVEFHFMATTVVQYAGWYLDDIAVTQAPPP